MVNFYQILAGKKIFTKVKEFRTVYRIPGIFAVFC